MLVTVATNAMVRAKKVVGVIGVGINKKHCDRATQIKNDVC